MTENEERAGESTTRVIDCRPDAWLEIAYLIAARLYPDHPLCYSDSARRKRTSQQSKAMVDIFQELVTQAPRIRAGSRACGGCTNQYRPDQP